MHLPAPWLNLLAAATFGASTVVAWRHFKEHVCHLLWDGTQWLLEGPADGAQRWPCKPRVTLDFGAWMLVCCHGAPRRFRWQALRAATNGAQWSAMRAAVYSRPLPAADAPMRAAQPLE